MKPDRAWMYKRLNGKYLSETFVEKVEEFIDFACAQDGFADELKSRCPCDKCRNCRFLDVDTIRLHLYKHGFRPYYQQWTSHGEGWEDGVAMYPPSMYAVVENAPSRDMVIDGFSREVEDRVEHSAKQVDEEPLPESRDFFDMLKAAEKPLFDGCTMSLLSAATRIINLECEYSMPLRCMDGLATLIKDICPNDRVMTDTFYNTRNFLSGLELPCKKIDVCPNGCMLFWNEDEYLEKCGMCNCNRYKTTNSRGKKIPHKVLRYLPITPRLQRLYAIQSIADQMTWHSKRAQEDGVMSHPSDGEAWKHLDSLCPLFASDPRNVRLGLYTDGFSPFGNSGDSYSCWPVILTPYNLPPWLCMKEQFLFLSLLIPGPESPKGNLDVYLQPLVQELKQLWEVGAMTYDVSKKQNFNMKAALLWTISDFPTYGMLSGWRTTGKLACPYCMENTKSFTLEHSCKHSWFDCHRQFLRDDDEFRWDKTSFITGRAEHSSAPRRLSGYELWERVSELPKSTNPVTYEGNEALKMLEGTQNWTKQSIFWSLPYWRHLLIRHNLDIMQVEKNVFDNIIHTILDAKRKKEDDLNSRKDLELYCKRRKLHVQSDVGTSRAMMPLAAFVLPKDKRKALCEWVSTLKFPDGFASDVDRCVDKREYKLVGLKSRYCHDFMGRLMPIALRELLPCNVWEAVTELSLFFRDICSTILRTQDMTRLEGSIAVILCKLERIFPPSFFRCMEHLPIHLPYDAKLGGPVQYRWMYPFKRFMYHLKRKVGNNAHVEGSICQAYLRGEISNFCKHYTEPNVDMKSKDMAHNIGINKRQPGTEHLPSAFWFSVGDNAVEGRYLNEQEYGVAHGYVLANCEILKEYEKLFETEIRRRHPNLEANDVWDKYDHEFPKWFKEHILKSNIADNDFILSLAMGPSRSVRTVEQCFINGYNFHTQSYGKDKSTMNYGVCVRNDKGQSYYGILQEIIELLYTGKHSTYRAVLFRCDWMDPDKGMAVHESYKIVDVDHTSKDPKYDPFILADQASQVYFTPYPSTSNDRQNWWAVFNVRPRGQIDLSRDRIPFQEDVINDPTFHLAGGRQRLPNLEDQAAYNDFLDDPLRFASDDDEEDTIHLPSSDDDDSDEED